jgi:putative hydrolase of the HAD superfamily
MLLLNCRLSQYIDICLSSANIGYEKPHSEAFKTALRECGNPETVWMIGDNIEADIKGAKALVSRRYLFTAITPALNITQRH